MGSLLGVLQRRCPVCRREAGPVCSRCLGSTTPVGPIDRMPGVERAVALFRYDAAVQAMILAAKNHGRRDILNHLGWLLAQRVDQTQFLAPPESAGTGAPLVTWIPASHAGRRRRGYDQSQILANVVAARLGLRCSRLLVRERGRSQTGRSRAARLDGPGFRVTRSGCSRAVQAASSVLVVDDVITTGASMAAAVAALAEVGVGPATGAALAWTASAEEVALGRVIPASRSCR